jgi:hypothetical protein
MSSSSKWSIPIGFSNQYTASISPLSYPCYMPCPSHPPLFYHPNSILWNVQVMKLPVEDSSKSCMLTIMFIGWTCGTHGGREWCLQSFGMQARG